MYTRPEIILSRITKKIDENNRDSSPETFTENKTSQQSTAPTHFRNISIIITYIHVHGMYMYKYPWRLLRGLLVRSRNDEITLLYIGSLLLLLLFYYYSILFGR